MVKEYILHSREGNSFHFRTADNPKSTIESFTVTYTVDGTAVMTGDYGCLIWKRNYYPNGKHDYGFPDNETDIGYFAGKVRCGVYDQTIKEFDIEEAKKDLKEDLLEDEEHEPEFVAKVDDFLGYYPSRWEEFGSGDYARHKMYEDLCEEFSNIDWAESMDWIGMKYTWHFENQFELLKKVSGLIREAVK